MGEDKFREALAALCHEQWSGWMKYLFSKCKNASGMYMQAGTPDAIIPGSFVERWTRQLSTPYDELPEGEKESDRKEADKFLALMEESYNGMVKDLAKDE